MVANGSNLNISMEKLEEIINKKVQKAVEGGLTNPTGTVISYMGNTAPTGYLFCDGTEYNISEYPNLAEQIKTEFGSYNYYGGDGETTFAVPDLRGEFLRGTGSNSHTNNITGITEGSGANVGEHQSATTDVGFTKYQNNFYTGQNTDVGTANTDSKTTNGTYVYAARGSTGTQTVMDLYTSRPTNTSVLYCIKY